MFCGFFFPVGVTKFSFLACVSRSSFLFVSLITILYAPFCVGTSPLVKDIIEKMKKENATKNCILVSLFTVSSPCFLIALNYLFVGLIFHLNCQVQNENLGLSGIVACLWLVCIVAVFQIKRIAVIL